MAIVTYVAKQIERAKVVELEVGSNTTGHTFIVTVGGTRAVTYIATAADTTTDLVAANLLEVLQAEDAGEFRVLSFAINEADDSIIDVTGPADGYPFTIAASGTGTFMATTTVSPLSPSDVADTANYSSGALPSGSDTLVVEDGDFDLLYNLDALAAIALTFIRYSTHTGRIGLPTENAGGYPEYLDTHLELNSTSIRVETNGTDRAGQVRLLSVASAAETVRVHGPGASAIGDEPVEITSLDDDATATVTGSGLAITTLAGQTNGTGLILDAEDSSIRAGDTTTGLSFATVRLTDCDAILYAGVTTELTIQGGGTTELRGTVVSAGAVTIHEGTLMMKTSGNPTGVWTVGNLGVLDASEAPASLAPPEHVEMYRGGTYLDPRFQLTWVGGIELIACSLTDVTINQGPGRTLVTS